MNRYAKSSKLSEAEFRGLVRLVGEDLTTFQIALVSGLNRNAVHRCLGVPHHRVFDCCEAQKPFFGVVEADESCFGPRRVKGRAGCGAGEKTYVSGIFERGGGVHCEVVQGVARASLKAAIRRKVTFETVINTDQRRSCNGVVELGYGHCLIDHGRSEFALNRVHINVCGAFWKYTKTRLVHVPSVALHTSPLHLKECEFRCVNRRQNLTRGVLKACAQNPLSYSKPSDKIVAFSPPNELEESAAIA